VTGVAAATSDAFTVIAAMAPTVGFTGATLVAVVTQPPEKPPATADVYVLCAPAAQFTDVIESRTVYHSVRPGTFMEGIGRCPAGDYIFTGFTTSFADCPPGWTPIAGGFYASNSDGSMATPTKVSESAPAPREAGLPWGSRR
jgi:hypothetical protein